MPVFQERFGRHRLNLLAEPAHVDIHHGVMRLVGRTAQRVLYEDDAKTPVDGAEHGAEDTDICFPARDNDRVDAAATQLQVEVAAGPGRVDVFVENLRGGNEGGELGDETNHLRPDPIDGH